MKRNPRYVALCFIILNENSTIFAVVTKVESFELHLVFSEPHLLSMHFRLLFVICFDFASVCTY